MNPINTINNHVNVNAAAQPFGSLATPTNHPAMPGNLFAQPSISNAPSLLTVLLQLIQQLQGGQSQPQTATPNQAFADSDKAAHNQQYHADLFTNPNTVQQPLTDRAAHNQQYHADLFNAPNQPAPAVVNADQPFVGGRHIHDQNNLFGNAWGSQVGNAGPLGKAVDGDNSVNNDDGTNQTVIAKENNGVINQVVVNNYVVRPGQEPELIKLKNPEMHGFVKLSDPRVADKPFTNPAFNPVDVKPAVNNAVEDQPKAKKRC